MTTSASVHVLHVLPPVASQGQVLWFAYLDGRGKWRGAASDPAEILANAGRALEKILAWEQRNRQGWDPNRTPGSSRDLPNLEPRWRVRVTPDCSEERVEWTLELLDESAWAVTEYDLGIAVTKLAHRIELAGEKPQPLLSTVPEPAASTSAQAAGFVQLAQAEVARVGQEIAQRERVLQAEQARIDALKAELRAVKAALATYQKHAGQTRKRRGPRRLEAV